MALCRLVSEGPLCTFRPSSSTNHTRRNTEPVNRREITPEKSSVTNRFVNVAERTTVFFSLRWGRAHAAFETPVTYESDSQSRSLTLCQSGTARRPSSSPGLAAALGRADIHAVLLPCFAETFLESAVCCSRSPRQARPTPSLPLCYASCRERAATPLSKKGKDATMIWKTVPRPA